MVRSLKSFARERAVEFSASEHCRKLDLDLTKLYGLTKGEIFKVDGYKFQIKKDIKKKLNIFCETKIKRKLILDVFVKNKLGGKSAIHLFWQDIYGNVDIYHPYVSFVKSIEILKQEFELSTNIDVSKIMSATPYLPLLERKKKEEELKNVKNAQEVKGFVYQ